MPTIDSEFNAIPTDESLQPEIKTSSCYRGTNWSNITRYALAGACFTGAVAVPLILASGIGASMFGCSKVPGQTWEPDPLCSQIDPKQQPNFYAEHCRKPSHYMDNEDRITCYALVGSLGTIYLPGLIGCSVAAGLIFCGINIIRPGLCKENESVENEEGAGEIPENQDNTIEIEVEK